jgi:serine/threonine protein phosphatase PrpC
MKVTVAAKTDAGRVRKKNEDRCGYDERAGIYVVCDGMGGEAAGEVAAELSVRAVLDYFEKAELSDNLEDEMIAAIELANTRVREAAAADARYHKMGSTLVAVLIRNGAAVMGNVGDTRGYLLHEGELRQISVDHSLVAEQVRRGILTAEQAQSSPFNNIVTRALGAADSVEADFATIDVHPHDTFLLASDGVIKFVAEEKLREIVNSAEDLSAATEAIVTAALNNGSDDNATCMLVRCEKAGIGDFLHRPEAAAKVFG